MPKIKLSAPFWVLLATCAVGVFHFAPFSTYQVFFSQGDHGRDAYAFEAVLRGDVPYRDFWWVYGPLMPYYYAIFYKLLGVSLQSILIGQIFLKMIAGIFIFMAMAQLMPLWISILTTLWYWIFFPDFFYTYNHTGGTTALMATLYFLFAFIKTNKAGYLYFALASVLLLCLVKINIGIFALAALLISVFLSTRVQKTVPDRTIKRFYLWALLLPFAAGAIYLFFLNGLTVYEVRQCLPYRSDDHPYNAPFFVALTHLFQMTVKNMSYSLPSIIFAFLILLSAAQTALDLIRNKLDTPERKKIFLAVSATIFFYLANLHEFLASGIVLYRSMWPKPFSYILFFLLIGYAVKQLRPALKICLFGVLMILAFLYRAPQVANVRLVKNSPIFSLDLPRGQIFVQNEPAWHHIVKLTADYLNKNLNAADTFLAIPYDPLYYFLAGKPSPSRQLIFFEHINIPPEQERKIIRELESHKTNYILISNRAILPNNGLGIIGETYCPILGEYLNKNFRKEITFGEWKPPPGDGWAWGHSVRILKRIHPL